jgi:SSS family solute:Na+ symporter
MHWIDWTVVAIFLFSMILVGVYFSKRAGKNVDSFFVSGRSLKWYVAGASMIATSFAADTPLWVGGAVRKFGVHAAWTYWAPLIGSALGVVLFARMWRRSRVVTDNEILELRYDGNSAKSLRGITAGMMTLLYCPLIIGWVSKAMVTISKEVLGISAMSSVAFYGLEFSPEMIATLIVMTCALILCAFSGLYGVVYTDFVQFIVATGGAFLLAWLAVKEVGGLSSMYEQLSTLESWKGKDFNFLPKVHTEIGSDTQNGSMSIWNIIGFFGLLWWGVALSGGYQAQRILASKNARHASQAMLLHTIVYYAVISFPWIIVALASLIVFPNLTGGEHEAAYPKMILYILPDGLRGIMVAAMIAAFISTMSTLFNWGSSYIVNDLYRRFLCKKAGDKHYVSVARLVTLLIAIVGGVISYHADNIQQLLSIFWTAGSGLAAIGVIRWLWWRVNAKGELVGFITTHIVVIVMLFGHLPFASPEGYKLNILTVENQLEIPQKGEAQVIIAKVKQPVLLDANKEANAEDVKQPEANQLYIRVFDPKGRKDVDITEASIDPTSASELASLKTLIKFDALTSTGALSTEDQEKIIQSSANLVGHKLSEPLLDPLMGAIFRLDDSVSFTENGDLQGARMFALTCFALFMTILFSLLTKPTDIKLLKQFVLRTRIFTPGWGRVIREIPGYQTAHPVGQVLLDWALVVATVVALLFAMNTIVLCRPVLTSGLFALFVVLLVIVLYRTRRECPIDDAAEEEGSEDS